VTDSAPNSAAPHTAAPRLLDPARSALVLIDFQARLMPAMEDAAAILLNARRLKDAALMFGVPVVATEQNPAGLGATVADLALSDTASGAIPVVAKMAFGACTANGFLPALSDRPDVVVTGCESHICVMQTALGLLDDGRRVFVVEDAVGSRRAANKEAALRRLERHGAEIVTTEMVVFEWVRAFDSPMFKRAAALIR